MESRLPKRKVVENNKVNKNIIAAANDFKFTEADPSRNPLTLKNGNPPHRSMRDRPDGPNLPYVGNIEIGFRKNLRRSRSYGDISSQQLKRPATAPLETIPHKIVKTTTTATSIFEKPVVSAVVKKHVGASGPSVPKAQATTAKVSLKRIPPYDYKARYNDLVEKHKVVREKLSQALSQADSYEQKEQILATTQSKMAALESENNDLKLELDKEKSLNNKTKLTIQSLKSEIMALETKQKTLVDQVQTLTSENQKIRPELSHLKKTHELVVNEQKELKSDFVAVQELLFKSNVARKDLHNEVLDLKGNIRVFCRVRPPLNSELNRMICGWQYMDETTVEISLTEGGRKRQKHEFSFDQVFHPQSLQIDIFELVSPLIQSAFDGYNVCIFAYGQTGSGKTFTMAGSQSQMGIIPRTVDLLFEAAKNYKLQGWSYAISVTFLEIYNEVLYDLLSNEQKDLEIRMVDQNTPQEITVSNLTEFFVEDAAGLRNLIEIASSNRATAATVGNERSSRSHAVTQIKLVGNHYGKREKCIGKINLIDLAGSESPKTSNRMDETKNINRSLSELTNVIMALQSQKDHVPYRNSKLTHLLMPSLGGNSKTLMFINVAPFEDCFKESVKSLRFAASVNACKTGKLRKNKHLVSNGVNLSNSPN